MWRKAPSLQSLFLGILHQQPRGHPALWESPGIYSRHSSSSNSRHSPLWRVPSTFPSSCTSTSSSVQRFWSRDCYLKVTHEPWDGCCSSLLGVHKGHECSSFSGASRHKCQGQGDDATTPSRMSAFQHRRLLCAGSGPQCLPLPQQHSMARTRPNK